MDHRLSDEHESLRQTVERFAHDEVAPVIGDYYERHEFPLPLVKSMGLMGLFGLPFPEDVGGMGGDLLALCLAIYELARVDSSVAITLEAGVSLGATPIFRFGSDDQRDQWLPRLAAGEILGAFGLTEPGGGSDAGAVRTTGRLDGDEWVLEGTKSFITNSGTDITAFVLVAALTGRRDDGKPEISTILVPSGTDGFTVASGYSKVGWCASDTHELSFTGARVPSTNLIGEPGRGYANFLSILDEGRIAVAALAAGLAQGCVDECVRYANQREAFGVTIGRHQAIAFTIAEMQSRAHVAYLSFVDAASRAMAGEAFGRYAAITKLYAAQAAMDNAREATQVFGGYGFMNETPVGRFYRDAKILEIGEGTNEVQRMLIARDLGINT
jgi:short-chain 2-methylacyl-CoA dehydrogenase